MGTKKLILDLDVGIDDAMALAYALASPEAELIGVTTVFGNVPRAQSTKNCLALLDLLGHPEVPVAEGADRALAATEPYATMVDVHGSNGIGGVELPASARAPRRAEEPGGNAAVDVLLEAAERYGDDLIYVPTGPLTNLAQALARDSETVRRIGRIVLMGGTLTQPGNVTPGAEANIASDPEAADAVFRSGIPVTMVGLDVTHQVQLAREELDRWRALATPAAEAYAQIVGYYIDFYVRRSPYLRGCALHDPLAVAVALDSTLVETFGTNLKVDLEGPFRGRTIGDPERLADPTKTTHVALSVDVDRFEHQFATRMLQALSAQ